MIGVNLIGLKYGRLLVVKKSDQRKNGRIVWECFCDCGKTIFVKSDALKSGNTKSCGCLALEARSKNGRDNKRQDRTFIINNLFKDFKYTAKRKNIKVSLTIDEYKFLIFSNCFYCGTSPSNTYHYKYGSDIINYNGIDRVNNEIGYEYNNRVPCCKRCNIAKNNMLLEDFKTWIIKIYNITILGKTE